MSERKEAGPGLPHLVAIAVFDGVEMLDVAGPMQVFGTAERVGRGSADYEVVLVAARRGFVRTSVGVPLVAERSWHDLGPEVGTLLVPGGLVVGAGGVRPLIDPELVAWLVESGGVARRIASVCTGAHIAAAAGLFDGRRATTHWSTADVLASEHPEVEVVADAIFVEDGPVWSSAGVSAGIDLALALVAADHGDDLARRVAQWMVVYLRRPGGQQQFSAYLGPPRSTSDRLGELLAWIPAHLVEDLSVEALARRVNVSPRHLARLFRDEAGSTPGAVVERMRIQAAVEQLVHTDAPLPTVAARAGFGSVAGLHRSFVRHHGLSPGEYRRRFTVRPLGPGGTTDRSA
ncbi:transcriptional regulator GlxA family with amidase domain [Rhodococcus sp. AG1013]|uniref:GlxA family transcriptional regulator n=1 Tax=Rhodococcus sp. AG1013 TaxID=2183996 RepID=UPI000E0A14C8|nr:GlxA family transcriptional regulator [Rhodococcus sp. AG1013]RDI23149.1 transcriptional regulator GlxA family with amidase domain [Rhodococcus sp. AG1013]